MDKLPGSCAKTVKRRIFGCDDSRVVWTAKSFPGIPSTTVAKILSRLAAKGDIRRVRKGIYYRPIKTIFGPSIPDPIAVAKAAAEISGKKVLVGGYTAYNALGLSNQVAGKVTLLSDRRIKSIALNNRRVRTVVRPILRKMTPEERAVLDALRDVNKISGVTPTEVLARIVRLIDAGKISFDKLAHFAVRGEPSRVRILLGVLGALTGASKRTLHLLKRSLNSTTSFKTKVENPLLISSDESSWRIAA